MDGIVINIDPVAVRLEALHVYWYSLAIILAIIAAVIILAQLVLTFVRQENITFWGSSPR